MTQNISSIDTKINNYIASHPELTEKGRDYAISIMIKENILTDEEMKIIEQPSIYSTTISEQNKEYVSSVANDNFIGNDNNTQDNIKTKTDNTLIIPGLKTDETGCIERSQFSVKELLKIYPSPEYKISRTSTNNQKETITVLNSKGEMVFYLTDTENRNYRIIKQEKNQEYDALIVDGKIQNCKILKKNINDTYTVTEYCGEIKNNETTYDKNNKILNKINFVVTDIEKTISTNDSEGLIHNIINKISNINIEKTLTTYKAQTGKDLIIEITNNTNLTKNEKEMLLNHLISAYATKVSKEQYFKSYIFNAIDEDIANSNTQNLISHLRLINNKASEEIINELEEGGILIDELKLKIFSIFSDYDGNYINDNSTINNQYHTGSSYRVTQKKDYIIDVYNQTTQTSIQIDLNNLCKNIPLKYRPIFFGIIQKLPGEVLEDINIDASFNFDAQGSNGSQRSYYLQNDETMNISLEGMNKTTIVHELGHAIDDINIHQKLKIFKPKSIWLSNTAKIRAVYNNEKEEYIKSGMPVYKEQQIVDPLTGETKQIIDEGPYCTMNAQEFFAECYTLIMLGESADKSSTDCIKEHFPKTFALVKETIDKIRSLPTVSRHQY